MKIEHKFMFYKYGYFISWSNIGLPYRVVAGDFVHIDFLKNYVAKIDSVTDNHPSWESYVKDRFHFEVTTTLIRSNGIIEVTLDIVQP